VVTTSITTLVLYGGGVKRQSRMTHVPRGWDNWDQIGMLEQIGVYKQPLAA
jgi:hypothetical protein